MAKVYLITYDVKVENAEQYPELEQEIKGLSNDVIHPLKSVWMVATDLLNAAAIFGRLKQHLKTGDRLLVLKATADDDWFARVATADLEWLKKHLS